MRLAADETGITFRCGSGKTEWQFFFYPSEANLDTFETPAQGGAKVETTTDHAYLGILFDNILSWRPWFKSLCSQGKGSWYAVMRGHLPGILPGPARIVLLHRVENAVLWGAEFLLDASEWLVWRKALNRLQVEWWKAVFGISDPTASWVRVLLEAGEEDRLSAKVTARSIALLNRLSLLHEEELPRRMFEEAWNQAGRDTWVGHRWSVDIEAHVVRQTAFEKDVSQQSLIAWSIGDRMMPHIRPSARGSPRSKIPNE